MSTVLHHQVQTKLATNLAAIVAVLSSAFTVIGQVSEGVRGDDTAKVQAPSMLRFETNVKCGDRSAVSAIVNSAALAHSSDGGLWLSGDTATAFADLQWIAGDQPVGVLEMDAAGRVSINLNELARAAGLYSADGSCDWGRIKSFIAADEGLLILAQVTGGQYRYLIHIGYTVPTLAGKAKIDGQVNLDNRYDSRISPRRRGGQKLSSERPPGGFDSLIGINPLFGLYNLNSEQLVPPAQIIFHELAEAHAKLELGLDYLPQGEEPGAHDVALNREAILVRERARWLIVPTIGENIGLRSEKDWQYLFGDLANQRKTKAGGFEPRSVSDRVRKLLATGSTR